MRKGLLELEKILTEHNIYSGIIEYLFMVYYEKQEIFYDREEGVWYSRIHGRNIDLEEVEDLCFEIFSFISSNISEDEEARDMEELHCRECGSLKIDSYGSGEDEHGEFEDYECLFCGMITRVYYEEAGKNA